MYHPHTIDATVLQKRIEEDWIFQIMASLSPDFEDLRSHILMNSELPSLKFVYAMIQHEKSHKKVILILEQLQLMFIMSKQCLAVRILVCLIISLYHDK
jgi:hypothetical protein